MAREKVTRGGGGKGGGVARGGGELLGDIGT